MFSTSCTVLMPTEAIQRFCSKTSSITIPKLGAGQYHIGAFLEQSQGTWFLFSHWKAICLISWSYTSEVAGNELQTFHSLSLNESFNDRCQGPWGDQWVSMINPVSHFRLRPLAVLVTIKVSTPRHRKFLTGIVTFHLGYPSHLLDVLQELLLRNPNASHTAWNDMQCSGWHSYVILCSTVTPVSPQWPGSSLGFAQLGCIILVGSGPRNQKTKLSWVLCVCLLACLFACLGLYHLVTSHKKNPNKNIFYN